jgi:predicted MPP superfamily phosphohydrolase
MMIARQPVVLIFLVLVVSIFVAAGSLGIRVLYRLIVRKPRKKTSRLFKWSCAVAWSLAAIGVLCIAYAYFVEPYRLEVAHVTIASDKLPPSGRPLRIVHISDLHCDPKVRLEEKLPDIVADLRPDLIAFTGDCINSRGGLPHFRRCMTRLAELAPTFAVKGNWDVWYGWEIDTFARTGATELDGDIVELATGGAKVRIAGIASGGASSADKVLRRLEPDAFNIFLYHTPDLIYDIARGNVDLCLAGHTHGGQVALPFYGALVTLSRYRKRFESGLYRVGNTDMYVSRGIGMEGGRAPRVRFLAKPEVTLIEVVPKRDPTDVQ